MDHLLKELSKISLFLTSLILSPHFINSQVIKLDTVTVSSSNIKPSESYQTKELDLNSSNTEKLSDVIKNTTGVYVKDYGAGQLSSLSIRGTSATHTKLIWNGFDITSATLGQSDFSLLPTFLIDQAQINMGHGSLVDGVGGIGGNIQVNNQFEYNKGLHAWLEQTVGSFQFDQTNASIAYSTKTISQKVKFWRQQSANDYPYKDISVFGSPTVRLNHSSFNQLGVQYDGGVKLNGKNEAYGSLQYINSDRELPAVIGAKPSQQTQFDEKIRGFLGFKHLFKSSLLSYKIGSFIDNFLYSDADAGIYAPTKTTSIQNRVDYKYYFNYSSLLTTLNTNHVFASGDGIGDRKQEIYSLGLKWEQEISYFSYDFTFREQFIDGSFSPLVYGIGARYKLPYKTSLRSVASTNVRYPTLNELYWHLGGDENLNKEKSSSFELGVKNNYWKWLAIGVSYYQITVQDWIQWTSNSSGLWSPKNIKEVESTGIEFNMETLNNFKKVKLSNRLGYNFTSTVDLTDEESNSYKKQLIYVPKHKINYQLSVAFKKFQFNYNQTLTSQVFVDETNTVYLPAIYPANLAVNYSYSLKKIKIKTGVSVRNIFDEPYQVVANRPMPGRNLRFTLGLSF